MAQNRSFEDCLSGAMAALLAISFDASEPNAVGVGALWCFFVAFFGVLP